MYFDQIESWLQDIDAGNKPKRLRRHIFLGAARELGLSVDALVSLEDRQKFRDSVSGYTWKARKYAMETLLVGGKLDEFQKFIDEMAAEYGDKLQPTEAGNTKIGIRRLLWDILCFAYGGMPSNLFYVHVAAAAENGREYIRDHNADMQVVWSPAEEKMQIPASYPPGYPTKLAAFLRRWYAPPLLG
jgi:hypothetical protein